MKNLKYTLIAMIDLIVALGITSCEQTDYTSFEVSQSSIYFPKDSISYSFGTTPYNITTYTLNVPVKIIGTSAKEKRNFQIEIISDRSNAKAGEQYNIPSELVIEIDSVNGIIPVEFIRENLGNDKRWQMCLHLVATEDFALAKEVGDQIIVNFNNIVEPPTWTDFQGNIVWPQNKLGVWNPIVWITFMEYFRKMKETVPATYQKMVEAYGPNLEHVTYGWPYDFDYAVQKYIMIPMYEYFQQHPELGVDMPNPQR